ncbi:MAG: HEXXH motif domain-containing protein [Chloroflexi bacterium]|nr:HEXXH motif domain-containing protein [Chloroflexota bacterium]
MSVDDYAALPSFTHHRLSWLDFDEVARGGGGAVLIRRLRRAERSRRLLLLRALVDKATKIPELTGPLPSPEVAWELLVRVQEKKPAILNMMLAHPYTGTWAGYTMRLLRSRISGVCPLWMHIGHVHALAAAAAIRAGLDFHTYVPLWNGAAAFPTLGLARLMADSPCSVAEVRGERGQVKISNEAGRVFLPRTLATDTSEWWGIRQLAMRSDKHVILVRLDDLDPYRGLYEPVLPQRLDVAEVDAWRALLNDAWLLIVHYLPDMAHALSAGLESVVPRPAVPFRTSSASTGEAFGSMIIARPSDATSLAATLVHEFQHIRLGGLLHLCQLHEEDPRERFYTPWRDDPRTIGGVLQGVYAFFGVTAFWRALARTGTGTTVRRATFEFAYWRDQTWRTLCVLQDDPGLTRAGRRFVHNIAERLGPWQDEPVPGDIADAVAAVAADHYAGWRIRYLRPNAETVTELADAWLAQHGRRPAPVQRPVELTTEPVPTPVPDGSWSHARADLTRLSICAAGPDQSRRPCNRTVLAEKSISIPDATDADFAYTDGRYADAVRSYRAELVTEADRPNSWVGLGLALSALGTSPAARTLLRYPELVRAVYRKIQTSIQSTPTPDDLAAWICRFTC